MTVKKANTVIKEDNPAVDYSAIIKQLSDKISELESKVVVEPKAIEQPSIKKEVLRNPLQNKKVSIEPINKGTTATVPYDSAQATMLLGTNRSIVCPMDKLGRLVDPLEPWEKDFLEDKTGLDLDIYSNTCFYKTARLKFSRVGRNLESATTVINLNDPYEYILYKIALVSPEIANKWEDRFNITYNYVIKDADAKFANEFTSTKKADTVLEYLFSIRNNKRALFNLLRLYSNTDTLPVKVDYEKSVEWLYQQLRNLTETKRGISNLFKLVEETSVAKLNTLVLIEDGVTCGAIIKKGTKYLNKSDVVLGYDGDEACSFLDNPENSEFKLWVSNEVEKFYKNK